MLSCAACHFYHRSYIFIVVALLKLSQRCEWRAWEQLYGSTHTGENCQTQLEQQPTCKSVWVCKTRDVVIFTATYIQMYLQKLGGGNRYCFPASVLRVRIAPKTFLVCILSAFKVLILDIFNAVLLQNVLPMTET